MSDEVRKAAERLRQVYENARNHDSCWISRVYEPDFTGKSRESDYQRDRDIVTQAYLAEHPADDDEPVTEEWLLSIGFELTREGLPFHREIDGYLKPSPGNLLQPGESAYDWKLEPPANNLLAVLFTRGDVRRICRALGIELKEPANEQ